MSNQGDKVRFALRRALESISPKYGKVCRVKSVSANPTTGLMTCDCEAIEDGTVLEDVRLSADFNDDTTQAGLILVPKVESIVLVGFLNEADAYLTMVSEVDFVYLNANTYGGLVKIEDLVDKLNNLENKVNTIINTFNTHTHPYVNVASPATTSPSTSPVVGTLTPTTKEMIENDTVQHGNGNLV